MNIDTSSNDHITIELTAVEQLAAFHLGSLRIPREQIARVHQDAPVHGWKRLRLPGSYIPNVIQAGTYIWKDNREFWFTHRWLPSRVVIELKPYARYDRLVLAVADGAVEVQRINGWLGQKQK